MPPPASAPVVPPVVVPVSALPPWTWKAILLFVLIATAVCGIVWVVVGLIVADPSTSQAGILNQLGTGFFSGLGALIGLLVGKLS